MSAENEEDGSKGADRDADKRSDLMWWISCGVVTLLAAAIRFYDLGLKPLHHDEGVNGFFLTNLFRDGIYKYDPANYHGPTLYYIALAFAKVFGLETIPVRSSVAIFGVLTVILVFFLRRSIGRVGSLFAGLMIALSPGMVFISRYFIHEVFFVFLSLGIVVAVLFFIEKQRAGPFAIAWMTLILLVCFLPSTITLSAVLGGESSTAVWAFRASFFIVECVLVYLVVRTLLKWDGGRPIYFLLASGCAVLLFATKETAFITLGVMAIACGCVWAWRRIFPTFFWDIPVDDMADGELTYRRFMRKFGSRNEGLLLIVAAAAIFIYLGVLFFSSFFTYPAGIKGAFEAYSLWTKTGGKEHTQNGMWAYLRWGVKIEAPVLILSAIGIVISLAKARHRFAIFSAFWALGIFSAYTLIPYKTPWLALSFLLPMCVIGGYAINELVASKLIGAKIAGGLLGLAALIVMAYQAYDLNFVRYDDDSMPYVYAHTRREFLEMVNEIDRIAEKSGKGREAVVQIVSPDYWPLVWYLKDYTHANFFGKMVDADNAEIIIAKENEQEAEVIRRYAANYEYEGSYSLRPGVDLMILVRRDLADPGAEQLYRIQKQTR
jgi:uncharacterized protein (TIGR03663 family)